MPGILNWFIAGFLAYQRSGLNPASVVEGNAAYKKEEDTAAQWIEVALVRSPGDKGLTLMELHSHYGSWMSAEKGYRGVSNKRLAEALRDAGYMDDKVGGVTRFEGVKFAFDAPRDDGRGEKKGRRRERVYDVDEAPF